jgi:hypothetical protein
MTEKNDRDPPPPPPTATIADTTNRRRPSAVSQSGYDRGRGDDLTAAVYSLLGPLTLTFVSSVIQSAAGFTFCASPLYAPLIGLGSCSAGILAYAMSLGVVSAITIVLYVLAFTFIRQRLHEKSVMWLSMFLSLWWAVGVAVTTFSSQLVITTILYFATWSSFVFSLFVLHAEWEQFRNFASAVREFQLHSRASFYCLVASFVFLVASVVACAEGIAPNICIAEEIYAIVVGAISTIICLMFLKLDSSQLGAADKFLAIFLVVWWIAGCSVSTIRAPFTLPSNGFFAAIVALVSSFFVAQAKLFPRGEEGGV